MEKNMKEKENVNSTAIGFSHKSSVFPRETLSSLVKPWHSLRGNAKFLVGYVKVSRVNAKVW